MFFKRNSSSSNVWQKGISFVELIVVISIILILSVISFPFYQSARKNLALERSVVGLSQAIRRAQEMAMSAQEFQGSFPAGGYGVYMESVPGNVTSYVIFADKDNNGKYGSGELVEQIYFESNVKINSANFNHIHVIFIPPDPAVIFTNQGGNDASLSQVTVEVSMIDDVSKYHDIIINKAGLVDIN